MPAPSIKMNVRGIEGAVIALKNLPMEVGIEALNFAVRKGAQVIAREAESNLRSNTGKYSRGVSADNIGVTTSFEKGTGTAMAAVSIQGSQASLTHLIEFGVDPHPIPQPNLKRVIDHPGYAERPFLRPAIDSKRKEAIDVFGKELGKAIEKTARRMRRTR